MMTSRYISKDYSIQNARERANDLLFKLHKHLDNPPSERFYPIKLEVIITDIYGWNIKRVPHIGLARYGSFTTSEPILGKIDVKEKSITISADATSEAERNFTLAHEIGHLVLHQASLSCSGGYALRKHSLRRVSRDNPDRTLQRQEREAHVFASELLMPEDEIKRRFKLVFDREQIRTGSIFVEKLELDLGRNQRRRVEESEPLRLAHALARYKRSAEEQSLVEFFGVSDDAMGIRLIELGLVF